MTVAKDIARLNTKAPPEVKLPPAATPRTKPGLKGLAPVIRPSSGGSISSPLKETVYTDRTFWPAKNVTSTDGVFTVSWKPIRVVKFLDAASNPVVMEYKEPV